MNDRIQPRDVSTTVVGGTLWTYLSFAGSRLFTFISTMVLARLLVPEQFGLMGYCLLAVQYLEVLNTFGLDAALIARRDRFEQAANVTFFVAFGLGTAMYGLAWVLAPSIAAFFRAPEVTDLLRVLALALPLGSLDLVHNALVQRQLRFKYNLVPDLSASLVKGGLAITLAWKGWGVWGLVYGHVAGEVVTTLGFWLVTRWRPRLHFDRQVTREMFGYGLHIFGVTVAGTIIAQADYLFVGRILGAAALGYYTLAYRLPQFVIGSFMAIVGKVGMPVLSRTSWDPSELRRVFLLYVRYVAVFAFPAGAGMALLAPLIIEVLYTDKWAPAIGSLRILAIALCLAPISYLPGVLYKAVNRPDILTRLAAIKVPFALGALWLGTRWGIEGVAVAQLAVVLFAVTLDSVMVRRVVQVRLVDMLKSLMPSLSSTSAMIVVLAITLSLVDLSGVPGLVTFTLIGAVAFSAALAAVSPATLQRAGVILGALFARRLRRVRATDPQPEEHKP